MAGIMTQTRTVTAYVLLAALALACSPVSTHTGPDVMAPSGGEHALKATEWVLTSLNGETLLAGTHIMLGFEERWISGFGGCNAYGGGPDSGGYAATADGSLTIPEMAITAMECPSPEGVMEQEKAYVQALRQAKTYRIVDDRLEIENAAGETILAYVRQEKADMDPSDLVGSAWQLVSMDGSSLVKRSSITLVFHDAHRISGHAGCRDYVAVYEAGGDEMDFSYTGMLGAVCPEEALLEQEGTYTTILGWTTQYRLSGEQLELITVRGETLIFDPLPQEAEAAFEGPTWSLVAFVEPNRVEDMPAPLPLTTDVRQGTEITSTFGDGRVRGSAGCNSYEAGYVHDGTSFAIEGLAFTEMACLSPEGVMDQEQRYLDVLKDVSAYNVYAGQLWLETSDGRALVFSLKA